MAGPLPHVVDPRLPATPYSNAKSRLAASVTQGFVLHASADLVDAAVREAHDVERVGDPAGVVQVWGEPGPVGLGEIGGDDSDPGEPVGVRLRGPAAQILGAVAFHHVDQHRSLQVDEAGGVDGGVVPVRSQERCLIDAEVADPTDTGRVVDKRGGACQDFCVRNSWLLVRSGP